MVGTENIGHFYFTRGHLARMWVKTVRIGGIDFIHLFTLDGLTTGQCEIIQILLNECFGSYD